MDQEAKLNCWEYFKCGRELSRLGLSGEVYCTASMVSSLNGKNGGENGGRYCWQVMGTFCTIQQADETRGSMVFKELHCRSCEFRKLVEAQEGPDFEA